MNKFDLEIIIPVRNEEANVELLMKRLDQSMKEAKIVYRVIFVVDQSDDQTEIKVRQLSEEFPILVHLKRGKTGKAFSILEGVELATTEWVAMIDGDLQYPPEKIPEMFKIREKFGVVIGNRMVHRTGLLRKIFSRANSLITSKLILGLSVDTQSGLKLFRKEIVRFMDLKSVGAWTFDAPLLVCAIGTGFRIGSVDVEFSSRFFGKPQLNLFSATFGVFFGTLKLRLREKDTYLLPPLKAGSMIGAGVVHARKRFITHTTIPEHNTALKTFNGWQKSVFVLAAALIISGLAWNFTVTITALTASLSAIYFIDVLFTLFLVLKSLHFPPEIKFSDLEIKNINETDLPIYSILVPLYHESAVLKQFLAAISRLSYPKNKLDVILLLEENDRETIEECEKIEKENYLRVVIVPNSLPRTKPKACNYGLNLALGEYIVVYDAEDQPEPEQLLKAVVAFSKLGDRVFCLQAKLNYYNPHHNLLTRLFTAEYSLWFDLVLPALQSIETTIPLGGTSNHFRRKELLGLGGWDAFNVTEDCDLGVRLFKEGKHTAIIDSVTLEEANSDLSNWIRQRSRWIKGYFQTCLVHMRKPDQLVSKLGWHALILLLVVGARTTFMLINPILWLMTISYFVFYNLVGPTIESFYPAPVFYVAVFSLAAGNFLYLYNYMIGCAKRGHFGLIKFVFLIPFYWILVSLAAIKAFRQLFLKPHYWEKTHHGLSLTSRAKRIEFVQRIRQIYDRIKNWEMAGGGVLVVCSLLGNVANFAYNAYLIRSISVVEFGLITLISSFLYISSVPLSAISRSVTHKSAILFGRYNQPVRQYWDVVRSKFVIVGLILTIIWLTGLPWIKIIFKASSDLPFILFTPVWLFGVLAAVNGGFLEGNFKFSHIGLLILVETLTKFILSVVFVSLGFVEWVYAAIPVSILVSYLTGWLLAKKVYRQSGATFAEKSELTFPKGFFGSSLVMKVTMMTFLSIDVILAKMFLTPVEAGRYAYVSLVGKMVFMASSLAGGQFTLSIASKYQGMGKDSKRVVNLIILLTVLAGLSGSLFFGVLAEPFVILIWGEKMREVLRMLPLFTLGMAALSAAAVIINYQQIRGQQIFPYIGFIFGMSEIAGLYFFHQSAEMMATVTSMLGLLAFGATLALHSFVSLKEKQKSILDDVHFKFTPENKLRILIFNWRDSRHVWAGGAEVYISELSKRWVEMGHQVTLFCGNDGHAPMLEQLNGVEVHRRGGFYFVYVWAFIYYLFKFKGRFDVIIDCENGIPFFTPLFTKEKVILLIHHVHQEMFKVNFGFPISVVGPLIEGILMPLVYRKSKVVTVSDSTKEEIILRNWSKKKIEVIHNGIDASFYRPGKKAETPLVLYVGRLRSHKSLPIFIETAEEILKSHPSVDFVIAGEGQEKKKLEEIVVRKELQNKIRFAGRISDPEKVRLYQRAWVFMNPSMKEGWGVTSVEANACGTPVVASNVPGLKDSIDNPHTGFLVNYGDIKRFSERILVLLENSRFRRETGKYAIKWARRFDWDASADKFIKVLKGELNEG